MTTRTKAAAEEELLLNLLLGNKIQSFLLRILEHSSRIYLPSSAAFPSLAFYARSSADDYYVYCYQQQQQHQRLSGISALGYCSADAERGASGFLVFLDPLLAKSTFPSRVPFLRTYQEDDAPGRQKRRWIASQTETREPDRRRTDRQTELNGK